ncbi:hypothetical protein [Aureimonas glaciei]|nr:hypothetical protein [Aureimonas glaciei]
MRLERMLALLAVGTLLMLQAGCHTTQLGQSVGFPAPQERAGGGNFR